MEKGNAHPTRLETPRFVIPPEVDISDYPWQWRTSPYTQSTEELLRPEVDNEPADDSTSISYGEHRCLRHMDGPAVTIPLRLGNREGVDVCIRTNSQGPAGTPSRAVSPVSSRLSMSENGIELHHMHLTLPSAGTKSTDNLVPRNDAGESKEHDQHGTEDTASRERLIPNYKPIPLRWPFQALLVVLIFAVFAFFEYQVRKLPPVRYRALEPGLSYTGMSAGFPAATSASPTQVGKTATATAPVPPVVKMSPSAVPTTALSPTGPTPAKGVVSPALTAGPRILIAAPRPPESAYPSPPASVTAYCGWKPPIWILYRRPGYQTLLGGRPTMIDLPALAEEIGMFTTTDPSWCPCTVLGGNDVWGGRWANDLDGPGWDTNDDGCKSAMNLISSFNSIKTVAFKTDIPALLSERDSKNIAPWDLADLPFQPFWGLPVTNANGDIAFPLEVRTKLFGERHDIFGNKLEGTGATATFFAVCYRGYGVGNCMVDTPIWQTIDHDREFHRDLDISNIPGYIIHGPNFIDRISRVNGIDIIHSIQSINGDIDIVIKRTESDGIGSFISFHGVHEINENNKFKIPSVFAKQPTSAKRCQPECHH
ncbi:hypothetical protein V8F33_002987 [Rhypophila sp. PSN 637]